MIKYDKNLKFGLNVGGPDNPPLLGAKDRVSSGITYYIDQGFNRDVFFTYKGLEKSQYTDNYYIINPELLDVSGFEITGVIEGDRINFNKRSIDFEPTDLDPALQGQNIEGKAVKFNLRAGYNRPYATNIRLV